MNLRSQKLEKGHSTTVRSLTAQVTAAALLLAQGLLLAPTASAETVARAQGRCKLTSGTYQVFDGHCTVKQKQLGSTMAFVVELDNGSTYRFSGPSKTALQIETHGGIYNAQFTENPDKGVFVWQEDGERNRLSVKLDTQHNTNVSHDDTQPTAAGTSVGAAVGALIGALLTGGQTASTAPIAPARQTNIALVGSPVPDLSDLVGARAGQAENTVRQRGYQFVRAGGADSGSRVFSFWRQPQSGLCIAIITKDGRYDRIVYANVTNQATCQ